MIKRLELTMGFSNNCQDKDIQTILIIICCFFAATVIGEDLNIEGNKNQNNDIQALSDQLQTILGLVLQQNEEMKTIRTEIDEHGRLLKRLSQNDEVQDKRLNASKLIDRESKAHTSSSSPSIYTAFACIIDTMTITCPANRSIYIADAYYGQYTLPCTEEDDCCTPHPIDDCLEAVQDNSPQDWIALRAICDNTSQCEFQVPGGLVLTCGDPYNIDYMTVYFYCLPETKPLSVAFTALLSSDVYLETDAIVAYDQIVTNTGGYFNADTSVFRCPTDGLYLFFISIVGDENFLEIKIMIDNESLICGKTHNAHGDQGSNMVMVECLNGQNIWVSVKNEGGAIASKRTSFSGVLINEY